MLDSSKATDRRRARRTARGWALGLLAGTVMTWTGGAGCATSPATIDDDDIGTMVYVGSAEIRGYRPEPSLVTKETRIDAARFPAVDVHCHWNLEVDPHAMLAAMDERNVDRAVNLSGGWGDELDRMLERYHAVSRDRFIIFCNVDFGRIDEPTFARDAVRELERGHRQGVRGLKVYKKLGLYTRDSSGALIRIDDPRLDPIWAACGRLGMPVLIHTADPIAFFQPTDAKNERWMQLKRHPDWSFYGPDFPDRDELLAQRERVMARHRGTTFIGAHVGNNAEDLAAVSRALHEHPNMYVDISGRVGELGRQPYAARQFFIEHQDRVLFGTDRFPGRPDQPRYRVYYRFLETDDEYFDYYDHPFPPSGDWKIYGVDLPDDVLRKVYHANADRIFGPRR